MSADGQKFLINTPVSSGAVFPITVVLNGIVKPGKAMTLFIED